MKKIIDGKLYDTEKSTEIGSWWNGLATNDFRHCSEKLYKTHKGKYFLHGDGGAMSKYSESNGNATWGSNDIIPLTEQQAQLWAEKHLDSDNVMMEFSSSIEEA